jgi:hypothetical protein
MEQQDQGFPVWVRCGIFVIMGWSIWRYFFDEGQAFSYQDWRTLLKIYSVMAVLVFAAGMIVGTIRWIRTGKW